MINSHKKLTSDNSHSLRSNTVIDTKSSGTSTLSGFPTHALTAVSTNGLSKYGSGGSFGTSVGDGSGVAVGVAVGTIVTVGSTVGVGSTVSNGVGVVLGINVGSKLMLGVGVSGTEEIISTAISVGDG